MSENEYHGPSAPRPPSADDASAAESVSPAAETPAAGPGPVEAAPDRKPPSWVPVHSLVFLLAAVGAVALGIHGAETFHEAREAGKFPPDVRRLLAFVLLFNGALGVAMVLALLGELFGAVLALAFRGSPGRRAVRVLVALLPLVLFGLGHVLMNPWLPELLQRTLELGGR